MNHPRRINILYCQAFQQRQPSRDDLKLIRPPKIDSSAEQGQDGARAHWQVDRLLFLNDVYFCAQDTIRLLQHTGVDLACGMDFNFVSGL